MIIMFADSWGGGHLCRNRDSTEITAIKCYEHTFLLNYSFEIRAKLSRKLKR